MPRGPRGEKRPADVIGNAVRVMRIATGEEPDDRDDAPPASPAAQLGKLGGAARARNLTAAQKAELDALAAMPEDRIDTTLLPEQKDWSGARRGMFFRPIKQQLTLRLDADLIDWFKTHAPGGVGYQTRINSALREYVAQREVGE